MAIAALKTETVYNVSPNLGGKMIKFEFDCATTADWVIFDNPIGSCYAILPTGAQSATAYATGSSCDIANATATELTSGSFTANERPASGYLMVGTEIVKYSGATLSSGSGTLTLDARGCFGTTAASASSATAYVLNTLIFTAGTVGLIRGFADVIEE